MRITRADLSQKIERRTPSLTRRVTRFPRYQAGLGNEEINTAWSSSRTLHRGAVATGGNRSLHEDGGEVTLDVSGRVALGWDSTFSD